MRLKFIMIFVFIFVYVSFFYLHTQNKNARIELALNKQIRILETHYALTKDYFLTDVKSMRDNISNNKKVIEIFSKAQNASDEQNVILREQLYKLLTPMYKRMYSRGILQFQFVFPNNVSFLRMHKPSKYGDDLSNIRYSFRYVNKIKKSIEGFEQGRTTHAFRYVFPFYSKSNISKKEENYLGAVEISLSSHALQDKLLNVNKIHSHFLVNKKIFSVKEWETKNLMKKYTQSIEHKDYMFALTTNSNVHRLKESKEYIIDPLKDKIEYNISLKKAFALYNNFKDGIKVITFVPIRDTEENKIVAYIVSYTNNANIYNICTDYKILNISIFIFMLALGYFIYKNLSYKNELIVQVATKTEDLKDLNENLEQRIVIEVEKSKQIEKKLFESEKMAAMGEMIGNIAHQWRQPLSIISTSATGLQVQKEYGYLTDEFFNETCEAINNNAQYLSKTIDDFRNFIRGDREKVKFTLKKEIDSFLHLVEGSIKNHHIKVILELQEDIQIEGYENELTQCLINIFNNAKDVLKEQKEQDRYLFILTQQDDEKVTIKFRDSGGGIDLEILPKIFEPYFTTKHKSQGTGLGLHMTYNLIVDSMGGSIGVKNRKFEYDNKTYMGAEFTIVLNTQ